MHVRLSVASTLFCAAFGAALAAGAAASADAIDDGWPYGGGGLGSMSLSLPGYLFIAQGQGTNEGQDAFGPAVHNWGDYIATHDAGRVEDWYTVHDNTFIIPGLYTNQHTEVTSVLDTSDGYPSVGTVFDETVLFRSNTPIGATDWFGYATLNDPDLGYASQFSMGPLFINTFLSTDDGMKDVVSSFGQQFTLFDIPSDASGAGDASQTGDVFAQLSAELTGAATGAAEL